MSAPKFSLRGATTDPVSTAKRADLPALEEPIAAVEAQAASALVEPPEAAPEAPVEFLEPQAEPVVVTRSRRAKSVKADPKAERPATRQGARGVTVWVKPDVYRRIKIAGLDLDLTTQDLMMDAIEEYLMRHQRRVKTS